MPLIPDPFEGAPGAPPIFVDTWTGFPLMAWRRALRLYTRWQDRTDWYNAYCEAFKDDFAFYEFYRDQFKNLTEIEWEPFHDGSLYHFLPPPDFYNYFEMDPGIAITPNEEFAMGGWDVRANAEPKWNWILARPENGWVVVMTLQNVLLFLSWVITNMFRIKIHMVVRNAFGLDGRLEA